MEVKKKLTGQSQAGLQDALTGKPRSPTPRWLTQEVKTHVPTKPSTRCSQWLYS